MYSSIHTKQPLLKQKSSKNTILNNVNQLYNKYLDTYKKNYDSEKVKDEEKGGRDYKKF